MFHPRQVEEYGLSRLVIRQAFECGERCVEEIKDYIEKDVKRLKREYPELASKLEEIIDEAINDFKNNPVEVKTRKS